MLKFHTNDTTFLATFEDFITTVFVMIDDLYRRYAPPEVAKRRHALDAKLSDSEIITVSLCGELAGIDSENAWYSLDNREGLRDLVDGQSGLVVLEDKGYTGEALADDLSRQGIYLMALKRSNSRTDWPRHMRQADISATQACGDRIFAA